MKLEKREITLNEADSLRDLFYLEKSLLNEYVSGAQLAERKETEREFVGFQSEVEEDMELLKELLEKSLRSVGISSKKKGMKKEG